MEGLRNRGRIMISIAGVFLYIIGLKAFAAPHKIAPGGAGGIGILINYMTGFPIGLFSFLFNIPLLFIIYICRIYDKRFLLNTTVCICLMSAAMDMVTVYLPVYLGDSLLAAVFAGAFMGTGLAFVHLGYANTGGISLLGVIILHGNPHFQAGSLIAGINMTIVLASGVVYKQIDSILYAAVTVCLSGLFMDKFLNGAAAKKLLFVMSDCTDRVRSALVDEHAGITIVKGEGGYSGMPQRIIIGAVDRRECGRIQKRIERIDPNALIIVTEADRVIGKRFGHVI